MTVSLEKVEKKVSLNIKIDSAVDLRLKRARKAAREQGLKYNVGATVEEFLLKDLKKVEKLLHIEQDINESENQLSLIDDDKPEFTANLKPKNKE